MQNLKKEFLTFATIFTLMVILDFIWLGVIQKSYFTNMLKKLNCGGSVKTNWPSIVVTYLVMAFSLYYFVFPTGAVKDGELSLVKVVMRSILIAMAIYVVFDFTLMNMVSAWGWNDAIKEIGRAHV